MNKLLLLLASALLTCLQLSAQEKGYEDIQKSLQTQMIMAEDGDTIRIPAGKFRSKGTLSMDGKSNIVIQGAGIDKTFISFKGQTEGAEGMHFTHGKNITLADLSVQDPKGDAVKAKDIDGISFINVRTEWTGRASKKNGAYGLYPVQCSNVLIDGCEAIGASDAGIYVGQSTKIIVRNTKAYRNVAGIEIENSTMADVYNCEAHGNTGGILVFDLPDLPVKKGGNVRVYNNYVHDNNYKNFAPKGNTVATIPPGTGVMILATSNVEVFENKIQNNQTGSLSIASYYITENKIKDKEYYPYPTSIYVHDNEFERKKGGPLKKSKFGWLFWLKFKKDVPHIIYDGIIDPKTLASDGQVKDEHRICIRNNGEAGFANLDAENDFKNISRDASEYDCSRSPLKAAELSAK